MLSFNLTVLVELALFVVFYRVSRWLVFAPLHRLILERRAHIRQDEEKARADHEEIQRLEQLHAQRLVEAQQDAGLRLREARFTAYRQNRIEADERRDQAEAEVAVFRARVYEDIETERHRYGELLPEIIEAMDRQINVEGSLF